MRAPVRVLDAGGWTDTWFSRRGRVCSLAVGDATDILVELTARTAHEEPTVYLRLPALGYEYRFSRDADAPGRHPLLEAALRRWAPPRGRLEVTVSSSVPPGSGTGTSASVVVALVAALRWLRGEIADPTALARSAHEIETVELGRQSGVQDQVAAAHGGANLIEVDEYPKAEVRALQLPRETWESLHRRLVTVFLGSAHDSSAVHDAVIARLERADAETLLAPLRAAALRAADALMRGDIDEYGEAMIANTEAQSALDGTLVSVRAREVIELARSHGAVGWKVNGAGGEGGTMTFIAPEHPGEVVEALGPIDGITLLPLRPAREGAHVVDHS